MRRIGYTKGTRNRASSIGIDIHAKDAAPADNCRRNTRINEYLEARLLCRTQRVHYEDMAPTCNPADYDVAICPTSGLPIAALHEAPVHAHIDRFIVGWQFHTPDRPYRSIQAESKRAVGSLFPHNR